MKINRYRTADIRLTKDSQGFYDARHLYQGVLYEWVYFSTRAEARRAAVEELKNLKEIGGVRYWN